MNSNDLRRQILDSTGCIEVDELEPNYFQVEIPNPRLVHEAVTLSVYFDDGVWRLNDLGHLAFHTPDSIEQVVETLRRAGAPFTSEGDEMSCTVTNPAALAEAIASFSYYIAAAPVAWHGLESVEPPSTPSESATKQLAKETRTKLVRNLPASLGKLLRLSAAFKARGERVKVPLSLSISGKEPWIVTGCIDTGASPSALQQAKASTSFMFDVLEGGAHPRYLIVRGSTQDVDHLAELYDRNNITTLSLDNIEPLIETTHDVLSRNHLIPA